MRRSTFLFLAWRLPPLHAAGLFTLSVDQQTKPPVAYMLK